MRQSDVQGKVDVVMDNLEKLRVLKGKTYDEFVSDFRNADSTLHRLQTSIQALLDIGGYIVASLGLRTPGTSAEIVEVLGEAGYLSEEKTEKYIKMSQFRNRIVHLYNHVDTKTLYDILQNEFGDIQVFYSDLLRIVSGEKTG